MGSPHKLDLTWCLKYVCGLGSFELGKIVGDLLKLNYAVTRVTTEIVKLLFPKLRRLGRSCFECYSNASFGNMIGGVPQGG